MHRYAWLILFPLLLLGADPDFAGRYTGEWTSTGAGGGGAFHITLVPESNGGWKCDVSFTFTGEEVKASSCTVKIEGTKLEMGYDFELQGNPLHTKLVGQWSGTTFDGNYETAAGEGAESVDNGSWQVKRDTANK